MNKTLVKFIYIVLFLWSVISLQVSSNSQEGTNPSALDYAPIVLTLLIELLGIGVLIINFKRVFISKLNSVVFLWLIYCTVNAIINSDNLFLDLRESWWWPLVYFLFYFIAYFDVKNRSINLMINRVFVLFVVLFIQYILIRSTSLSFNAIFGEMFVSLNQVFYVALLLPFSFLFDKKSTKYLMVFLSVVAALLSFKRSVLIFITLVSLISIYFDFLKNNKNKLVTGIWMSAVVLCLFYFVFAYVNNVTGGHIFSRFEGIKEDGGSGREAIYEKVWDEYQTKSWDYQLFGSGHNAVRKDAIIYINDQNLSAHNDFIEILYDFGIVGAAIYIIFILRIFNQIRALGKVSLKFYNATIATFVIFIVMSMVSHLIIYPTYYIYLVIIWAIAEGQIRQRKMYKNIECKKFI